MTAQKEDDDFQSLRDLAYRLDLELGVEKRKLILAGNEKLTRATDPRLWKEWFDKVEQRMRSFTGDDVASGISLLAHTSQTRNSVQ